MGCDGYALILGLKIKNSKDTNDESFYMTEELKELLHEVYCDNNVNYKHRYDDVSMFGSAWEDLEKYLESPDEYIVLYYECGTVGYNLYKNHIDTDTKNRIKNAFIEYMNNNDYYSSSDIDSIIIRNINDVGDLYTSMFMVEELLLWT